MQTNTFIEPHFIVVAADHVTYTWELNDGRIVLLETGHLVRGRRRQVPSTATRRSTSTRAGWTWTFDRGHETL